MGYVIDFHDSNEKIKNISDDDIKNTIQIAEKYDFIIVVVGDNSMRYKWSQKTAGENTARSELNLAGNQLDLVMKLKETGKNVIVVYVNGRPISEPWISENINAIIEAWEPGSFGGIAVAEVILERLIQVVNYHLLSQEQLGSLKCFIIISIRCILETTQCKLMSHFIHLVLV